MAPIGIEVITARRDGDSRKVLEHRYYCRSHGLDYETRIESQRSPRHEATDNDAYLRNYLNAVELRRLRPLALLLPGSKSLTGTPAAILAVRYFVLGDLRTRASTSPRARGMKQTPVSSASTRSPGLTATPQTVTGLLTATVLSRHLPVQRADAARPDRVADAAPVIDVAHRAVDDGADLALAGGRSRPTCRPCWTPDRAPCTTSTSPGSARLCASISAMPETPVATLSGTLCRCRHVHHRQRAADERAPWDWSA